FVGGPWSETGHFTVDVVNEPPSTPVVVAPVGDIDTFQPAFVVDPSTDPEGDAIVYLFEVFVDASLAERVAQGQTTEPSWTPNRPLEDNTRYWWRVSTEDERGAGGTIAEPVAFSINTANDLPAVPTIVTPAPGFVSSDRDVVVSWETVADADGDPVTYTVQVSDSVRFETVVFEYQETQANENGTASVVVEGLDEDTHYHVRVRASDPFGSTLFRRHPFSVNAVNTPPEPPQMLAPADAERTLPRPVQMVSKVSSDPDGDPVTYTFTVFSDAEMTKVVYQEAGRVPLPDRTVRATFTPSNEAANYTWIVTAEDGEGSTSATAPRSFTVVLDENRAPRAPLSLTPILSAEVTWDNLTLAVGNASDPDGDALTYTFQVYADAALTQMVWERSGVVEESEVTATAVTGLDPAVQEYYWLAYATDANGLEGTSTSVSRFVQAAPEAPQEVRSGSSNDGCSTAPGRPSGPFGLLLMLAVVVGLVGRRQR
ncbi:MAG: fibronectin type III domain-containing protein, partial [Myxococcota bacterium]